MTKKDNMNYKIVMDKQIDEIKGLLKKPSLLLHVCCGPCSTYVIEYLANYFDITIYFYNSNLDSDEEYQRRADELIKLSKSMPKAKTIKLIFESYQPEEFSFLVKGLENEPEGGKRCLLCYHQRLSRTAKYAKEKNYDYFTTTLSISPYKNARALNSIGSKLEKEYDIKYLYADFKKADGYKRSIELSKEYDLYRQEYCGCIYSKKEREAYANKNN